MNYLDIYKMFHDFLKHFNNISRCEKGEGKDKKFEVQTVMFLRIQIVQIRNYVSCCVVLDVADDGDALTFKCKKFKKL
jgi:hypothetical protein